MSGLILAIILILTVALALVAGIGCGYIAANAFFYLIGHRNESPAARPLTAAQASSGD